MIRRCHIFLLSSLFIACASVASAQFDDEEEQLDIGVELAKIRARQGVSLRTVRQSFYLGNLAISSGQTQAARQVYAQVIEVCALLPPSHQASADVFRRRAAMGLAKMDMELYFDAPLRFDSYSADSTAKWQLLTEIRSRLSALSQENYAPVAAEAAVQRAFALEKWDTGALDMPALERGSIAAYETALYDLNISQQLAAQADSEYVRVEALSQRSDLKEGVPDLDVTHWISAASERRGALKAKRDSLHRRVERFQVLIIEEKFNRLYPEIRETMDAKISELRSRGDGRTDPFADALLPRLFVNQAVLPTIFEGPSSVLGYHKQATISASVLMSQEWVARRQVWYRKMLWERSLIEAGVTGRAISEAARVADTLAVYIEKWTETGHRLPADLDVILSPLPDTSEISKLVNLARQDGQAMWTDATLQLATAYVAEREEYEAEYSRIKSELHTFRLALDSFAPDTASGGVSDVQRYLNARDLAAKLVWLMADSLSRSIVDMIDDVHQLRRPLLDSTPEWGHIAFVDAVDWVAALGPLADSFDGLRSHLAELVTESRSEYLTNDAENMSDLLDSHSRYLRETQQRMVSDLLDDATPVFSIESDDPLIIDRLAPLKVAQSQD